MEFLQNYIMLVVLGVCLCVGFIIKHLIPGEKINKFIPLIVGLLGILLAIWNSGWQFTPEILLSGLVSGLASTGLYEMFGKSIAGFYDMIKNLASIKKNE